MITFMQKLLVKLANQEAKTEIGIIQILNPTDLGEEMPTDLTQVNDLE